MNHNIRFVDGDALNYLIQKLKEQNVSLQDSIGDLSTNLNKKIDDSLVWQTEFPTEENKTNE